MLAAALAVLVLAPLPAAQQDQADPPSPHGAVPSQRQLLWHEREFYGFLHFTTNTFTDKEWGYGDESPDVFAPTDFDAEQIVALAAEVGMRGLILTCKHHDGFCLWPTATTDHSVKSSAWRDGRGDVVGEIAAACRRHGIGFGVYLSPWDRNHPEYGHEGYPEVYRAQLRELLTRYGPVFEVWWDGANGGTGYYGGARETRRIDRSTYYGWDRTIALVRELQPNAVIFSDAGPDVRWVGNESGLAGDPCWATYTPHAREGETLAGPGTTRHQEAHHGHRDGERWIPAEVDVSIRPGWFYHAAQDGQVRDAQNLVELWYGSVGHGASLLLNVPPDRRGRIHETDAAALRGMRRTLAATFDRDLAEGALATASAARGSSARYAPGRVLDGRRDTYWATGDGTTTAELVLTFAGPCWFNVVSIREYLPLGLRVDDWALDIWSDGAWHEFARGTGIGSRRLWRGDYQHGAKLRLRVIDAAACPAISDVSVHAEPPRVHVSGAPSAFLGTARATLRANRPGAVIRYTLDGTPPGPGSPRYEGPIVLDRTCTLRAAAEHAGGMSPFVLTQPFEAWNEGSLLAPVVFVRAPDPGLGFAYYEGGWQTLDQLAGAAPVARGTSKRPDLTPARRDEHFALVFEGLVRVPSDGLYSFHLTSDDGSRLRVHDRLLIDNDGLHGMEERTGRVGLKAGLHPIRIEYFNATGGRGLELSWEGPGFARQAVPAEVLSH